MKFAQGQLKQTLKILAYQFVSSVEKMYVLHHQQLYANKQELYCRVLQSIEVERRSQFTDDCVKILENSYDEKMKNQCFEKDFSIISVQNHSVSRQSQSFDQSDCFDHHHLKDSFDESDYSKLKKTLLQRQQAVQATKYNPDPQEGFFVHEKIIHPQLREGQVKHQQLQQHDHPQSSSIHQQQQHFVQENSQSELENQSKDSDQDYEENSMSQKNNDRYQKEAHTKSSIKKTTFMRKKYRSYTEEERWEAVSLVMILFIYQANIKGVEFACKHLDIPKKNITRWMKRKQRKQKVRGRKPSNPNMEQNLTNWIAFNINLGTYLTQTEIRNQARIYSGNNNFKASKGWLEKYFRRNKFISDGLNELLGLQRRSRIIGKKSL